jgi:hypothetical protein
VLRACRADFDVINDHTGPLGAMLGGAVETPVVHTGARAARRGAGLLYTSLSKVCPEVGLISLSMNQRKPLPELELGGELPERRSSSRPIPCTRTTATTSSSSGV